MAICHYEGNIGTFDYDDNEFVLKEGCFTDYDTKDSFLYLKYIGKEIDGSKIKIPEGITNCVSMFGNHDIKKPPIIPSSVVRCDYMFQSCEVLEVPPVIPESVISAEYMFCDCISLEEPPELPSNLECGEAMFMGCSKLVRAPKVPSSCVECDSMFADCVSLEQAPELSDGIEKCMSMFNRCTGLKNVPIVPESVKRFAYIFENCTDDIKYAGRYNISHRGCDYITDMMCENKFDEYYPSDFIDRCKSDINLYNSGIKLIGRCDRYGESNLYRSIIDAISGGLISTSDELDNEIDVADKYYQAKERKGTFSAAKSVDIKLFGTPNLGKSSSLDLLQATERVDVTMLTPKSIDIPGE